MVRFTWTLALMVVGGQEAWSRTESHDSVHTFEKDLEVEDQKDLRDGVFEFVPPLDPTWQTDLAEDGEFHEPWSDAALTRPSPEPSAAVEADAEVTCFGRQDEPVAGLVAATGRYGSFRASLAAGVTPIARVEADSTLGVPLGDYTPFHPSFLSGSASFESKPLTAVAGDFRLQSPLGVILGQSRAAPPGLSRATLPFVRLPTARLSRPRAFRGLGVELSLESGPMILGTVAFVSLEEVDVATSDVELMLDVPNTDVPRLGVERTDTLRATSIHRYAGLGRLFATGGGFAIGGRRETWTFGVMAAISSSTLATSLPLVVADDEPTRSGFVPVVGMYGLARMGAWRFTVEGARVTGHGAIAKLIWRGGQHTYGMSGRWFDAAYSNRLGRPEHQPDQFRGDSARAERGFTAFARLEPIDHLYLRSHHDLWVAGQEQPVDRERTAGTHSLGAHWRVHRFSAGCDGAVRWAETERLRLACRTTLGAQRLRLVLQGAVLVAMRPPEAASWRLRPTLRATFGPPFMAELSNLWTGAEEAEWLELTQVTARLAVRVPNSGVGLTIRGGVELRGTPRPFGLLGLEWVHRS